MSQMQTPSLDLFTIFGTCNVVARARPGHASQPKDTVDLVIDYDDDSLDGMVRIWKIVIFCSDRLRRAVLFRLCRTKKLRVAAAYCCVSLEQVVGPSIDARI